MTRPVSQTINLDLEIDLRGMQHNDDGEYVDNTELNEFTIGGRSWDEAKLREFFIKRHGKENGRYSARAVWAFIEAIADDNADADAWEGE